jgi:hypothetical protein
VYRVGYNRVVRNWVLLKLGEEEEPGSASP